MQRNLKSIEGFAARLDVLAFDTNAARQFGQIKAELEQTGQSIGSYDMMLAGHARSQGLVMVTNNTREFSRVDGLRIENWLEQT